MNKFNSSRFKKLDGENKKKHLSSFYQRKQELVDKEKVKNLISLSENEFYKFVMGKTKDEFFSKNLLNLFCFLKKYETGISNILFNEYDNSFSDFCNLEIDKMKKLINSINFCLSTTEHEQFKIGPKSIDSLCKKFIADTKFFGLSSETIKEIYGGNENSKLFDLCIQKASNSIISFFLDLKILFNENYEEDMKCQLIKSINKFHGGHKENLIDFLDKKIEGDKTLITILKNEFLNKLFENYQLDRLALNYNLNNFEFILKNLYFHFLNPEIMEEFGGSDNFYNYLHYFLHSEGITQICQTHDFFESGDYSIMSYFLSINETLTKSNSNDDHISFLNKILENNIYPRPLSMILSQLDEKINLILRSNESITVGTKELFKNKESIGHIQNLILQKIYNEILITVNGSKKAPKLHDPLDSFEDGRSLEVNKNNFIELNEGSLKDIFSFFEVDFNLAPPPKNIIQSGEIFLAATDNEKIYTSFSIEVFNLKLLNSLLLFKYLRHELGHMHRGTFVFNKEIGFDTIDIKKLIKKHKNQIRKKIGEIDVGEKEIEKIDLFLKDVLSIFNEKLKKEINNQESITLDFLFNSFFTTCFNIFNEKYREDEIINLFLSYLSANDKNNIFAVINNIFEDYRVDNDFTMDIGKKDPLCSFDVDNDLLRQIYDICKFSIMWKSADSNRELILNDKKLNKDPIEEEKKINSINWLLFKTKMKEMFPIFFIDENEILSEFIEEAMFDLIHRDENNELIKSDLSLNKSFSLSAYYAFLSFLVEDIKINYSKKPKQNDQNEETGKSDQDQMKNGQDKDEGDSGKGDGKQDGQDKDEGDSGKDDGKQDGQDKDEGDSGKNDKEKDGQNKENRTNKNDKKKDGKEKDQDNKQDRNKENDPTKSSRTKPISEPDHSNAKISSKKQEKDDKKEKKEKKSDYKKHEDNLTNAYSIELDQEKVKAYSQLFKKLNQKTLSKKTIFSKVGQHLDSRKTIKFLNEPSEENSKFFKRSQMLSKTGKVFSRKPVQINIIIDTSGSMGDIEGKRLNMAMDTALSILYAYKKEIEKSNNKFLKENLLLKIYSVSSSDVALLDEFDANKYEFIEKNQRIIVNYDLKISGGATDIPMMLDAVKDKIVETQKEYARDRIIDNKVIFDSSIINLFLSDLGITGQISEMIDSLDEFKKFAQNYNEQTKLLNKKSNGNGVCFAVGATQVDDYNTFNILKEKLKNKNDESLTPVVDLNEKNSNYVLANALESLIEVLYGEKITNILD